MIFSQPVAGRAGGLFYVRMPPAWFHVLVPPRPMTAAELLAADARPTIVADGAMFGFCAGEPHDYARYACGTADYGYFDRRTRVSHAPKAGYESRGGTVSVVGAKAEGAEGWRPAAGASVAWQGYPTLVRHGEVIASSQVDTNRTERAGVGIDDDDWIVFVSGVNGMRVFAAEARNALRLKWLYYSDGGQSRVVAVRGPQGVAADLTSNLTARRVPVFVAGINPLVMAFG